MSSGNLILTVKHQRKPLNIRKKSLSIWVLPLSKQTLMRNLSSSHMRNFLVHKRGYCYMDLQAPEDHACKSYYQRVWSYFYKYEDL
ncbi:hypothetical protein NC651_027944 [Populus alba x Populus x berolinensis]|nr:hypothetical protein NC651_027944 [Populus alba x Populus x berolinensis]